MNSWKYKTQELLTHLSEFCIQLRFFVWFQFNVLIQAQYQPVCEKVQIVGFIILFYVEKKFNIYLPRTKHCAECFT